MAKNKKRNTFLSNNKKIKNNLDLLANSIDGLYKDTYYTTNKNSKSGSNIRSDIEKSIDNIMSNNYSNTSVGNISRILSKIGDYDIHKDNEIVDAIDIFKDESILGDIISSYNNNRWILERYNEIDTVLKYMPKLQETLNCKTDSVLSADHFAKDFANFYKQSSGETDLLFTKKMDEVKRVHNLAVKLEEWYDYAQTYGERYIYIVPYSTALSKLLDNRPNTMYNKNVSEMSVISEGAVDRTSSFFESGDTLDFGKHGISNLTITFNSSGILESAIEESYKADTIIKENKISSLNESFLSNINESSDFKMSDQMIPDDIELPKSLEDENRSPDGIYTRGAQKGSHKINIPGCVVKELDNDKLLPIYIDKICLGYYYIEISGDGYTGVDPNMMNHTADNMSSLAGGTINKFANVSNNSNQNMLRYISSRLSSLIDDKFINANQDLKKEIYMILKHNELFNSTGDAITGNINVTFIPAEDVEPIIFKRDPITNRGISDLAGSLFPAKLYSSLYITHVLGTLTRGQDKRVYYVKQNIETNISKTLINVVNQIKKGNFGARQMENINSILNITGRFNDMIIPLSQSGESPIQFEIMEGQKFDYQSDLMDKLEEMAVNISNVPLEMINARQSLDYAIQATMSSSKFMRFVYKRQDLVEKSFSNIITKIYNYEYNTNEDVEMSLPSPAFLNMNNGAQLISSTIQYVELLASNQLPDEDDAVKAEFIRLGTNHYLATHMNMSLIEELREQSKINVQRRTISSDDQ